MFHLKHQDIQDMGLEVQWAALKSVKLWSSSYKVSKLNLSPPSVSCQQCWVLHFNPCDWSNINAKRNKRLSEQCTAQHAITDMSRSWTTSIATNVQDKGHSWTLPWPQLEVWGRHGPLATFCVHMAVVAPRQGIDFGKEISLYCYHKQRQNIASIRTTWVSTLTLSWQIKL